MKNFKSSTATVIELRFFTICDNHIYIPRVILHPSFCMQFFFTCSVLHLDVTISLRVAIMLDHCSIVTTRDNIAATWNKYNWNNSG